MTETLQISGKWHILLAELDLVQQAGLNQADFEQDMGFFKYKSRAVILSHTYEQHLVVSMEGREDADLHQLMDSFSKVVGYKPFCKYNLLLPEVKRTSTLLTYEWDKVDPQARFNELNSRQDISDLVRI